MKPIQYVCSFFRQERKVIIRSRSRDGERKCRPCHLINFPFFFFSILRPNTSAPFDDLTFDRPLFSFPSVPIFYYIFRIVCFIFQSESKCACECVRALMDGWCVWIWMYINAISTLLESIHFWFKWSIFFLIRTDAVVAASTLAIKHIIQYWMCSSISNIHNIVRL